MVLAATASRPRRGSASPSSARPSSRPVASTLRTQAKCASSATSAARSRAPRPRPASTPRPRGRTSSPTIRHPQQPHQLLRGHEGKQVSINDKSGASANIDIQVNYSLNPDAALSLYSEYGTQESFVEKYISNDVRAVTREVSGGFDTVTMLTDRSQFTKAVQKALTEKWKGIGLTVEQVSVQDVRCPKNITKSYSEAQAAEVAKQKAQNEQETAKVEAETKKIEAQGEADANAVLANSLNDQVIQQHYIDALKSIGKDGNLVVVPDGSQPIVGTSGN